MSEYTLQAIASAKIFWAGVFCIFYGLGGIKRKWIRRYVGPFWMGVGILLFSHLSHSFSYWLFAYPLLLSVSLHLGYGGEDVTTKIRKRSIYGVAIAISSLPLVFSSGLWALYIFHFLLCVLSSVFYGVINPTRSARDEETLIACLSSVIPLFLI